MKTIYLIRHAESLANAGGKSMQDCDIPLSERGQQQAVQLAQRLPPANLVFTSAFLRTQQTAQYYLQQQQLTSQVLPILNEFSYLAFEEIDGLNAEQRKPISLAYWEKSDPYYKCGEKTDSFAEFSQRVDLFLQQTKNFPDQTCCFTHGIWIALLVWKLLGFNTKTAEDMRAFRQFQLHLPMTNTMIWELKLDEQQNGIIHCSAL
ncbi:histidine phosphatase family protein [Pasteurellaceae bacterium 22721_9_1]